MSRVSFSQKFEVKILLFLFLCVFGALEGHSKVSQKKYLCVLNFERAGYVTTRNVNEVFRREHKNVSTRIVHEAKPKDLLDCVKYKFDEIIIIAHTSEMRNNSTLANLVYFDRIRGKSRDRVLNRNIEKINQSLGQLGGRTRCLKPPKSTSRSLRKCQLIKKKKELKRKLGTDKPIYMVRPFLNKIFELFAEELRVQAQKGELALKKVRFLGCEVSKMLERYDVLDSSLKEHGIKVEAAPSSFLGKLLYGKNVSNANNKDWLRQSLNSDLE